MLPSVFRLLSLIAAFVSVSCFYCKNPGYSCRNGGICQYNGECKCTGSFQGFDCGLDSSTISNSATCTIECKHKGICYSNSNCYCTKDYMGPTCNQAFDTAKCSTDKMTIQAFRPSEFTGEIFLMQSMTKCKLVELHSTIPGYKLYELNVPHKNAGGDCQLRMTRNKTIGEVRFDVDVATSHTSGQFGMYDEIKTVSCIYDSKEHAVVKDATDANYPVKVTMTDSNGDPIQGTLQHQDPMYIHFELQNEPADTKSVRVNFLEAYAINPTTNNIMKVTLIKDECSQLYAEELGYSISNEMLRNSNGNKWDARVHLKAIPVIENEPLYFNFRLTFCRRKCREKSCRSPAANPLPVGRLFKQRNRPITIA